MRPLHVTEDGRTTWCGIPRSVSFAYPHVVFYPSVVAITYCQNCQRTARWRALVATQKATVAREEGTRMQDFWNETERAVWAASFALAQRERDTAQECEATADRCLEAFRSLRYRGPAEPYRGREEHFERPRHIGPGGTAVPGRKA